MESFEYVESTGRVTISAGLADIEHHLGIPAGSSALTTDFVTSIRELGVPEPWLEMFLQSMCVGLLSDPSSRGLCFKLSDGLEEFFRDLGVLRGRLVQLDHPSGHAYPLGSVDRRISDLVKQGNRSLSTVLWGKTRLSNFTSCDTVDAAKMLGGRTLITPDQTVLFNSKDWLREQSVDTRDSERYLIAPGLVVRSLDDLRYFLGLEQYFARSDSLTVWVKMSTLCSGDGVVRLNLPRSCLSDHGALAGLIMGKLSDKKSFIKVARVCGYITGDSGSALRQLEELLVVMPLVAEVDIGSLPDTERVVANFNLQAIVSDSGVYFIETSGQQTDADGNYQGNKLPLNGLGGNVEHTAREQFLRVCYRARAEGYRGHCGADVIVRHTTDGRTQGFVIDFNARFNASTPLLSHTHRMRETHGAEVHALNTSILMPRPVETFHEVRDVLGERLLTSFEQDAGVIPVAMSGFSGAPDKLMRASVLATSREAFMQLLGSFSECGVRYGSLS